MTFEAGNEHGTLTKVLGGAIDDVIDELRMIDLVDLVSFIRFGDYPALEDLLQSSTELYFRPGSLTFGWTAAVEMDWNYPPIVTLGMEFRHQSVFVFFDLSLEATSRVVEIAALQFEKPCRTGSERVACLAEALLDARLSGRAVAEPPLPRRRR